MRQFSREKPANAIKYNAEVARKLGWTRSFGWLLPACASLLALACARPLPPPAARPAVTRPHPGEDTGPTPEMTAALEFAATRFRRLVDRIDPNPLAVNAFPSATTDAGVYNLLGADEWDAGFYPMSLWLLYELSGSQAWKQPAAVRTLGLWGTAGEAGDHDLGYKMMAFAEAYRLTGDPAYQSFVTLSAASLMKSFNAGGVTCVGAFKSDLRGVAGGRTKQRYPDLVYPVIVSSLMSQVTLFAAAALPEGKREWHDNELVHTLRVVQDFVRPDGSTHDLIDYETTCPFPGIRKRATYKTADEHGTWARGQALALHGLSRALLYTHDPRIRDAARKVADFFLLPTSAPPDGVPYWDLRFGARADEPRDSSAAAIAAAGLLELATLPEIDADSRGRYRLAARRILQTLSTRYLARNQTEGVLAEATPDGPSRTRQVSMIAADYFFLDGIRRLIPRSGIVCAADSCDLEAESARPLAPEFRIEDELITAIRFGAAAGRAVQPARASYPFTLPVGGQFTLAAVVHAPGGSRGQVHLGVRDQAGQLSASAWSIPPTRSFQELPVTGPDGRPRIIDLPEGRHHLVLDAADPAVAFDRLVLRRRSGGAPGP